MKKQELLSIGGDPWIDLMPTEVRAERKLRGARYLQIFALFLLIVTIFAGSELLRQSTLRTQQQLAMEKSDNGLLLYRLTSFAHINKIDSEVELLYLGQRVGMATEINWKTYLDAVQATLPEGVKIDTINIEAQTPLEPFPQSNLPLEGSRVATLHFTAKSPTLSQIPVWLNAITSLPGYSDAATDSVVANDLGIYTVSITIHINKIAFTNRFSEAGN